MHLRVRVPVLHASQYDAEMQRDGPVTTLVLPSFLPQRELQTLAPGPATFLTFKGGRDFVMTRMTGRTLGDVG